MPAASTRPQLAAGPGAGGVRVQGAKHSLCDAAASPLCVLCAGCHGAYIFFSWTHGLTPIFPRQASAIYRNKTTYAQTDRAKKHKVLAKAELPGLREFVFSTAANFTKAELTSINKHLTMEGLEPVPIPDSASAGY